MAITHPAKRFTRYRSRVGPPAIFAAAVVTAFATLALAAATLPRELVLPLTSVLLFVLAGAVALVAWRRGRPSPQAAHVTYWDVAGALTFIGICAGALVDPDQMVRLLEAQRPH
jgi:Na+-driven multidrug efflux pump